MSARSAGFPFGPSPRLTSSSVPVARSLTKISPSLAVTPGTRLAAFDLNAT